MEEEEKTRRALEEMQKEHRSLDQDIARLSSNDKADRLQLQRMKKRKLWLRDRINMLQGALYDDIIA